MGKFQDDDLPYQTNLPAPGRIAKSTTRANNEQDLPTLKIVHNLLADGLEGLYKDFNAFDITELKELPTTQATEALLREIAAKQLAYEIMKPCYDAVTSAIQQVDN